MQKRWTIGAVVGVAALAITGTTLVGVSSASDKSAGSAPGTIVCPDVRAALPAVPARAAAEVDRNLAQLRTQIDEANKRLVSSQGEGGKNFVQNAILGPLKDKRTATIDRITIAIGRAAPRPNLDVATLATCRVQGAGNTAAPTASSSASPSASNHGHVQTGPVPADFIPIRKVRPTRSTLARTTRRGSGGTFTARCGNNERGHFNSDNVIVAPGVGNGAHHLHDYVGNTTTSAASTDQSLAAGRTTCRDRGDLSSYYWPVIRDITKTKNQKRVPGELDSDLNVGKVLRPKVTITYSGNPFSKVVPMPRFLRVLTGDAKSFTNGGANQRAKFTCQGFTNRISTDKYTLCPDGRGFTRIAEFPSCWDGKSTDSANHRTHILFPDAAGKCPRGTVAVPKLTITLTYNVPRGPSFATDGFPEQLHKPITDHNDFINVMSPASMKRVVNCLNAGRRC
ncbi:protein of unknown function [Cryptosporangium aurantiacum]|uniref:DUF1996 domain-containing protein n=1 Tax=Cryptosporangium aurantiacum TaxID=134849 RepID=A0A1M7TXC9_9ACTN|nr:DUF1996 domain-containing protein [Cryptosporangium aurantiacum]SHN75366.1 protein of unknown function [Cryptosporangium aurantiacum]